MKKEKGKKPFLKAALDAYEMPDFTLPTVEMRANREACIEGCKGILEYEQGRIRLNTGSLVIVFSGENIEISVYSQLQTVISGNIVSVEFETNTEA